MNDEHPADAEGRSPNDTWFECEGSKYIHISSMPTNLKYVLRKRSLSYLWLDVQQLVGDTLSQSPLPYSFLGNVFETVRPIAPHCAIASNTSVVVDTT
jgi:hypothetical protein